MYLKPIATPAAAPAAAHQRNEPVSWIRTANSSTSATGTSTPTSVSAIRE